MRYSVLIIFTFVFLSSCMSTYNSTNVQTAGKAISSQYDSIRTVAENYSEKIEIKYAKGLKVDYREDGIHVSLSPALSQGEGDLVSELVIQPGKHNRFICTTALQLGNFEVLGMEDKIVGVNSLKNIFSERILAQIADGKTVKVGKEGVFDIENVIALKPDYIFVSASKYGGFEALKECGIPLVPHHGYKEITPLGQAEWIKLIGLLTGETKRANAVFDYVEKEYLSLKEKVQQLKDNGVKMPTVLSGRQVRDGWYVMGGKSYMAQLFADAGARYIMSDVNETGGTTLDFETVYARGINAEYWQMDGSFDADYTLDALAIEDARYADIKAYKEQKVLFCNFTLTPYRELAGVSPHLMLADFVKAFHPELLPSYKPKFYDFIK